MPQRFGVGEECYGAACLAGVRCGRIEPPGGCETVAAATTTSTLCLLADERTMRAPCFLIPRRGATARPRPPPRPPRWPLHPTACSAQPQPLHLSRLPLVTAATRATAGRGEAWRLVPHQGHCVQGQRLGGGPDEEERAARPRRRGLPLGPQVVLHAQGAPPLLQPLALPGAAAAATACGCVALGQRRALGSRGEAGTPTHGHVRAVASCPASGAWLGRPSGIHPRPGHPHRRPLCRSPTAAPRTWW